MNVLIHIPTPSNQEPIADFINSRTHHNVFITNDLSTISCVVSTTFHQTYTYKKKNYLTFYAGENGLVESKLQHLTHILLGEFYQNDLFEPQHDYTWYITYWFSDGKRKLEIYNTIGTAYTKAIALKDYYQLIEIKGIPPQKED